MRLRIFLNEAIYPVVGLKQRHAEIAGPADASRSEVRVYLGCVSCHILLIDELTTVNRPGEAVRSTAKTELKVL